MMHCNRLDADFEESTCIARRRNAINGRRYSMWANGRHPIVDPDCKDCEQGRKVAEGISVKQQVKPVSEIIMGKIPCERCGGKYDRDEYHNSTRSKTGKMKICPECYAKAISTGKTGKSRQVKNMQQNSVPLGTDMTITAGHSDAHRIQDVTAVISIDMTGREHIIESIKKMADQQLRTFENQVLFILMTVCGGIDGQPK
jgi:hypothetical protein